MNNYERMIQYYQYFYLMNKTEVLLNRIHLSEMQKKSARHRSARPSISSLERTEAEIKYRDLTNLTKNQQINVVRKSIDLRSPRWKHDYYRVNEEFTPNKKEGVDEFPHNNKKYNVQFLNRSLRGENLKFPLKDVGFFPKPRDRLYSKHYVPIVGEKRKYNQDFELRTSLFGKTWVDDKRDRIIDKYQIQSNPFSTQKSNQLISTMRPARKHVFS